MAKRKAFWVPKTLYSELKNAAQSKGQTLEQYLDELLGAFICGEVVDHGN
jgi:hypothetical protein